MDLLDGGDGKRINSQFASAECFFEEQAETQPRTSPPRKRRKLETSQMLHTKLECTFNCGVCESTEDFVSHLVEIGLVQLETVIKQAEEFGLNSDHTRHVEWLIEQVKQQNNIIVDLKSKGKLDKKTQAELALRTWAEQQWPTLNKIFTGLQ